MDVMAQAVQQGKVKTVGVCNFTQSQITEAHNSLEKYDIPLSVVMTGYNILRRYPETNGVFEVCKKHKISIIPYAPLAEGSLTGKYRNQKLPLKYLITSYFGHLNITCERNDNVPVIKRLFSKPRERDTKRMEPIMREMESIAEKHNKTIAQVAINWLITAKEVNVVPIPKMRKETQVQDNIGAVDWKLADDERNRINKAEQETR